MTDTPSHDLRSALEPFKHFDGPLPDYDSPMRCVYESGIQYAVNLLAETLNVDDWEPCDGTEEFDGDLGGTLFNIVLAAMPKNADGDPMHPEEVRRALASDTIGNGGGEAVPVEFMYEHPNGMRGHSRYRSDLHIDAGWRETPLYAHPPAAEPVGLRELTADDLAKAINPSLFSDDPLIRHQAASPYDVAASQQMALNKARGILARLQSPATPVRTDDTAQALVKAAQPEIDSVGSHAGNGGRFDPYAQSCSDRNDIAYAIIKGSAGERAAWHAMEFQTGNWSDALRSADAVLTLQPDIIPASGKNPDAAAMREEAAKVAENHRDGVSDGRAIAARIRALPSRADPDRAIKIARQMDAEDGGYPAREAEPAAEGEALSLLKEMHRSIIGQAVGGGDGQTYTMQFPPSELLNRVNNFIRTQAAYPTGAGEAMLRELHEAMADFMTMRRQSTTQWERDKTKAGIAVWHKVQTYLRALTPADARKGEG